MLKNQLLEWHFLIQFLIITSKKMLVNNSKNLTNSKNAFIIIDKLKEGFLTI